MLEKIKQFESDKIKLVSEIKEFVQNKNNPLDERWNLFCEAGKSGILPSSSSYFEPDGINWYKNSLYDTFNMQRCETYSPLRLENSCLKYLNIFTECDYNHNKFKESYLEEFVWNVMYDW